MVNRLAQGLARFKVQYAFFRDINTLAIARVTANARGAAVHRKTAKATNFNSL